jgi:hypothetical protein
MFCLYCGGRLPLLRDLALGEFCSPEHREHFERLEHEFQESDPGRAPARCPLVRLTPGLPSGMPQQTPKGGHVVAPISSFTLPHDPCAGSSPRETLSGDPVSLRSGMAEPGYIGPLTRLAPFRTALSDAPAVSPASAIALAGPGRVASRLLRLRFRPGIQNARPAPLLRPSTPRNDLEPVLGVLHVANPDTMSAIAATIEPPQPVVRRKKRFAFARSVRWRPLALAAALGGVAFLLLRMTQPSARAAERLPGSGAWSQVKQDISDRAAINMVDDFRGGLDSWRGRHALSGWTYDQVGFIRPSSLAVYDPSLHLRDYQVEFLGQLRNKGFGGVVRAADLNNYYAVRLAVVRPGPMPQTEIVRYPVINGREGKHIVKPLPLTIRPDSMFRGRILANGDEFTLMVQDQVVDLWSDARLRRGGVGFFCQRGDDARLRWVEITHHDDTLGRLCALIAPYNVTGANGAGINE